MPRPLLRSQMMRKQPALEDDAAPNLALPWVVRLRFGMVIGGLAALACAAWFLRFRCVSPWSLIPVFCVFITNMWLHRMTRGSLRSPQAMLGVIFAFDILCLTFVLALTDGPMNPFSLLYLVQITLAAVVLQRGWTWALSVLSAICFGLLFFVHLPFAGFHLSSADREFLSHLVGMWIAFVIAVMLISFFTGKVSHALRLREQEVLALQDHIARHERLTSLVTLAAGAAHELGTPLGTIAVVARELERYASTLPQGDTLRDDARLIRSEVERCQRILQKMNADGAEPMGEASRLVEVGELIRLAIEEFPSARHARIAVDIEEPAAALFLPVGATVQSLTALVSNALDAGSHDGHVTLSAQPRGAEIVFSVCDNGVGMSDEILRRVAEPFFTTKEAGRGMGLGTFLVRSFAERLGGGLSYESAPGRGTTATLTLPTEFMGQAAGKHG